MPEIRDCEYGNYRDFDPKPHWSDYIDIPIDYVREAYKEFLHEAADACGLDTSEWESDDWSLFEDIINDYR